jgi:hypothetical protein
MQAAVLGLERLSGETDSAVLDGLQHCVRLHLLGARGGNPRESARLALQRRIGLWRLRRFFARLADADLTASTSSKRGLAP